ncbi:sugar ABC transporter ATP-binding protein [Geminicoccus roseus]|uniref:sugar ABC transporter ATP-binding protein n=1 Tax=Geminicoccus roseus TaxID=404900 RepID=UPI0003F71712|nr:sugar ABC transporter ATP-binding protein [Geminicoccus roseus]
MSKPFLQLLDITKTYPGVTALSNVSLSVAPGEVVGLIGENGAGKSTLMKILGGVVSPSRGRIMVDGTEHAALTVNESLNAGIAFVHQELNLFENLDVAANIFIGREPLSGGFLKLVDKDETRRRVAPLLERLDVDFAPDTPVAELSIAERQMVEIAKALSLNARLIIMDEPTSSLTLSETERLLSVIAELKAQGVAIIYISHRLNEVKTCADRVVCLRDGHLVGELPVDEIDHPTMIRLMIGRDLKSVYIPPKNEPAEGGLVLDRIRTSAFPDHATSFTLRRGEILGLAGLIGSGRTSLARTIFGVDQPVGGSMTLDGQPLVVASPQDAIARGIYLAPEDRKRSGLILEFPIRENISLADLWTYAPSWLVRRGQEKEMADQQRVRLGIKTPSVETPALSLSGGNQQKVVLAKWLSMRPQVIIFDEPTRGIDVGAKAEIYQLMRELAESGVAILMISSDMEEVIGVSDQVAVMHEGEIAGFLGRDQLSEHAVLELAVGHRQAA